MKREVENQISEFTGTRVALWLQGADAKAVFVSPGRIKHLFVCTNKAETNEGGAVPRTTVHMLLPERERKREW